MKNKSWMEQLVENYKVPTEKGKRILTDKQLENLRSKNKN